MGDSKKPYVLALDVGTTSVRAHIYDQYARCVSSDSRPIQQLYPAPGRVEIDEEVLWQKVQHVIIGAIAGCNLEAKDITCMGITCLRNTFITWDKETGKPFHHFISWQDMRASDLVRSWENSFTLKALNSGSRLVYAVTGKSRYLAASVLRFRSQQVILRLIYQIQNDPLLQKRVNERQVMYGTIDTYLLWRLTGETVFATEYSNVSSSSFYDPFSMEYSNIVSALVKLPLHILPPVKDTSGLFGHTEPHLFGCAIPITAMVADQQSAMFGQCCFEPGDVKCTMGTGTFIDCNTGNKPHASIAGLYPLIGWKIGDETTFIAEGLSSDTGLCIEWSKQLGFFDSVAELSNFIQTVPDAGGTFFIPAFNGLQAPINDDKACCGVIGLRQSTSKAHIMRAVIESLAFRFKLLYKTIQSETKTPLTDRVRCDGGVCNNDFLVQLACDLISVPIDRPAYMETTSLGAAFLAGLAVGVWKDKDELKSLRKTQRTFTPSKQRAAKYYDVINDWMRAVKRCRDWNSNVDL